MPVTRSTSSRRGTTSVRPPATDVGELRQPLGEQPPPVVAAVIGEAPSAAQPQLSTTATTSATTTATATAATDETSSRYTVKSKKSPSQRSSKSLRLARVQEELASARAEAAQLRIQLLEAKAQRIQIEELEEEERSQSDLNSYVEEWIDKSQRTEPQRHIEEPRPIVEEPPASCPEPPPRPSFAEAPHPRVPQFVGGPTERKCYSPPPPPVFSAPPKPETRETRSDIHALAAAIAEATRHAPRYPSELPTFDGSTSEWLHFRAAYIESSQRFTKNENVARIRRSLRGEAKEATSCLFLTNADPASIMKALEIRFGRPDNLLLQEIEKIKKLPKLSDDTNEFCVFASKINNVVAAIRALQMDEYMQNPDLVRIIVEKFDRALRYRWFDYVSYFPSTEPKLAKLANFLLREADQCARFAPPVVKQEKKENASNVRQAKKSHRTFTQTEVKNSSKQSSCPVCQDNHWVDECAKFKKLDIEEKWKTAREAKACFRCLRYRHRDHRCKYKPCGVNGCKGSHHSSLHFAAPEPKEEEKKKEIVSSAQSIESSHAYLKIVPITLKGPKSSLETYALLDEGSTITLVDSNIAEAIGASGPVRPLSIEGVAGTQIEASRSKMVEVEIQGRHHSKMHKMTARTIDSLHLSPQTVSAASIAHCRHLQDVSDQLTLERAAPTVIIGQDNWHLIVSRAVKSGPRGQPVASLTELGWVLHGVDYNKQQRVHYLHRIATSPLDEIIERHFELDNIGIVPQRPQSDSDQRALDILERTCKRTESGRFEVGLLWRDEEREVPDSRCTAVKRLYNIEKKLDKNPALKEAYEKQMQHLHDSGYAETADQPPKNTTWYLPHFAVVNKSKPKPRIVHDAAARSQGVSLNDLLLPGPDLLQSLPGVLMRFRQLPIAVSADIKEMFLQIRIRDEDRDALRFLWRGSDRTQPPREHRMTSVIFGASSSPCTAIFVKNRNARDYEKTHPEAAAAIVRNHYMDDYLQSFNTIEEAARIAREVDAIHKQAHFELRGWTSNEPAAIEALTQNALTSDVKLDKETEKVLGLRWRPTDDTLGFNVKIEDCSKTPTKREALRVAMSIFDPLGLITPINIQAKHLLQETWRLGIGWDDALTPELEATWRGWLEEINKLALIRLPRAHPNLSGARELQLHTFVDASQAAYAAACYWRVETETGDIAVSLIAAKGRVAPLKTTSIPRLELQAAVLGARLAEHVVREHDVVPAKRVFWTDSRTVLAWIRNGSRSYKPYVAHRLAAIEELTSTNEWRWVPTHDNVADDATRGTPTNFDHNHRWYRGPEFLYAREEDWPTIPTKIEETTGEEKTNTTIESRAPKLIEALPQLERFSSWLRLVRATARVLQFVNICKHRQLCNATREAKRGGPPPRSAPIAARLSSPHYIPLEGELIHRAEKLWIICSQEQSFAIEKRALTGGSALPRDSRLRQLSLVIEDDVIRLKSRIAAAENITDEQRAPAVLDGRHAYTRLYIEWQHRELHHSGVEAVTNQVRQRFFVLRLRPTVRNIIKSCVPCRRRRAAPPEPPTGDLPAARVAHHARPFTYTGLDYFGPLSVTVGRRHEKRYVALFTCLTSRAVHLEIAASLSTDSAIMALRRMMARRGCPSEIWSDNGTNFRGADAELRRAALEATRDAAANYSVRWRFIPPSAPFMGGAWERMVRSVKNALAATLHERHPPEEVLHTLLVEAEHTVNSRPLTHVSVSPDDLAALTPNDLLLGGASRVPIPGAFIEGDTIGRRYWRHAQRLADAFWSRWVREAMPLLQNRREPHGRGHDIGIGDIVLVVDNTLPRNTWPLGVIAQLYPGPDGVVRTVDVRTKTGTLRRPVKKLVWLQTPVPEPSEL